MCEKEIKKNSPSDLQELLKNGIWEENNVGFSNSIVYKVKLKDKNTYLKISTLDMLEVENEANKYKWLKGKISVPEVLYFNKSNYYYLLMSEIEGLDASQDENLKTPLNTINVLANGLKLIHQINIKDCPFVEPVGKYIDKIKSNNKLDHETLKKLENKPKELDLVFTHGDYCLPNVIINDNKLSGFIDMATCGIADRHVDLADIVRSIRYNFKREDLVEKFLNIYGLEKVNRDKLDYYIMISDLL